MKSYLIVGLGRFGRELARQLCRQGCEVLAMDTDSDLVQQMSSEVTHAVVGDGQDKEVLRALGARNFDCGVVAIGDNFGASVLVTMNMKELGIPYPLEGVEAATRSQAEEAKKIILKAYRETRRAAK